MILKLITAVQKLLIRSGNKYMQALYYKLAALHFKIHFKKDLLTETLENTEIARFAAKRHSRMVVSVLYSKSDDARKRMIRAAARGSFTKTIILNASI
jgi:ferritin-like protein